MRRTAHADDSMMLLHLLAAVAGQASDYRASGFEPGWLLTIEGRWMVFEGGEGPPISVRIPRRRAAANGYRYVTRRMTVEVLHEPCGDEAERVYADTVTVVARNYRFMGCGGEELPPESLVNTSWDIVGIDGETVSGVNYQVVFDEDRFTAIAGCNRLSASFTEEGQALVAGPVASTRMACQGPAAAHERALLRVLGSRMTIGWEDGATLVLGSDAGHVRLRRN
jgi:heat shock protein HslJ